MAQQKLLIDEYPILVLPSLAEKIGLNEAIVLQQIHYWLQHNQRGKQNDYFMDGRWWTKGNYTDWRNNNFTWWSEATVKRTFLALEKAGLLISANHNDDKFDHTKWYTIDYQALDGVIPSMGSSCADLIGSNCADDNKVLETTKETNITPDGVPTTRVVEKPKERKRDPIYDAIAEVWNTQASGFIVSLKGMLLGKGKRGAWKDSQLDTPTTQEEIRAFGLWLGRCKEGFRPTTPETIQRWYYEFRASATPAHVPAIIPIQQPELSPDELRNKRFGFTSTLRGKAS